MERPLKMALCRNSDNCPHAKANMPLEGTHTEALVKRFCKALEMTEDEPAGTPGRDYSLKWIYTCLESCLEALEDHRRSNAPQG